MLSKLEANFKIYNRERWTAFRKIIFGFIGVVATVYLMTLLPTSVEPIYQGIALILILIFGGFFVYAVSGFSQRPSAEKRIFANFYQSLKHFDFYVGGHKEGDLKTSRKYLKKAVDLIKNASPTEFIMVKEIIDKEIGLPLDKLAENIDSRLIPPKSSDQIAKKLKAGYNTIEKIALGFFNAQLKEIKKFNVNLKNFSIIPKKPPEKSFTDKIRAIPQTKTGLFFISIFAGYIVTITIALLMSIPFGWEISDSSIGASVIMGGAGISTIVYFSLGKTTR